MPDLFAGNRVSDLERAKDWYGRLLGSEPSFFPNEREAVWELAEHRFIYVELFEDGAGGALHTIVVDDFDERIAAIAAPGHRASRAGDVLQRRPQVDLPRP